MSLTIVSQLYNVNSQHGSYTDKINSYLKRGKFLLSLDAYKIIFIGSELKDRFLELCTSLTINKINSISVVDM